MDLKVEVEAELQAPRVGAKEFLDSLLVHGIWLNWMNMPSCIKHVRLYIKAMRRSGKFGPGVGIPGRITHYKVGYVCSLGFERRCSNALFGY